MPSYFVNITAGEKMLSFVFDTEQQITGQNWQQSYKLLCEQVNKLLDNAGLEQHDPKNMIVNSLSLTA